MTKLVRLSSTELQNALKVLPQWRSVIRDGQMDHIRRKYQFKTFETSWAFLTRVAMKAHRMGHHPTIINNYNIVELELTTHDVGGISELDVKMAKSLDKAALEMS